MLWVQKKIKTSIIIVLLFIGKQSAAQRIDNISTFRNIQSESYFRFNYDNDFFTKTDYYYTQGITIEYVHPALKKFPLMKLLYKPKGSLEKYGVAFNMFGYTPTSTSSFAILYGDRPFASAMAFKIFVTSSDSVRFRRITSTLHVGAFGPIAQGEEIQTEVHRWFKNKLPKGWNNQIQNDVIINYQLNYEKKILETGKGFLLNAAAEARAGTLNDFLAGGFNFMAGHFNGPYQTDKRKKVEYYLYGQSRVSLIGFDAMMQGGMFNRKSPYTISNGQISRVTFQADAGIIFNFKRLYFSYTQSYLTKEFKTSRYHRWGGVSLGFSF